MGNKNITNFGLEYTMVFFFKNITRFFFHKSSAFPYTIRFEATHFFIIFLFVFSDKFFPFLTFLFLYFYISIIL